MLAAMQYSKPSLTASGVSPFHQAGDGRSARTVSWPGIIEVKEYAPFCPVTSQLPVVSATAGCGRHSAASIRPSAIAARCIILVTRSPPGLWISSSLLRLANRPVFVPVIGVAVLHEIADAQWRVFRGTVRTHAARQARYHRIEIGDGKIWYRVALDAGPVDHAMWRRGETVIGPTRHHVADVDDVGSGDWGHLDPIAVALHLQTPDVVLHKNGEGGGVGMRTQAELAHASLRRSRRIMQQIDLGERLLVE